MSNLSRAFVRFQKNPSSVRYASAAIMSSIVIIVLAGALLMRLFDSDDYPTFGGALWFTLQTVTTVGYGDNPPTSALGQVIAAGVMLVSIGLLTVVTAVVTSVFIRSISREQDEDDRHTNAETLARIEASLAAAHAQLERLSSSTPGEHLDDTQRSDA